MIRHAQGHRWRDAQGFVDAAEIVVGDEQPDRRNMVLKFLAKSVRQPREAAGLHPEGQIAALNV